MTVQELVDRMGLTPVALPHPETEVLSGYVGDMPSWVMGNASEGCAWITILNNRNIAAVATLADTACVILAEGVQPDEGVAELAEQKGINLLLSEVGAYETALRLRDAL